MLRHSAVTSESFMKAQREAAPPALALLVNQVLILKLNCVFYIFIKHGRD